MDKLPIGILAEILRDAVAINRAGDPVLKVTGIEERPNQLAITFQTAPVGMVIAGLASHDGEVLVRFEPREVMKGDAAVLEISFSRV